ncbi:sensor histidine kinase [Frigoribacterium salinisoli]
MQLRRPTPTRVVVVDSVLALLLFVVGVLALGDLAGPRGVVAGLGLCLALALRRLAPGFALTLSWAVAVGEMVSRLTPGLANLAICAVLYATAARGSDRTKWAGLISVGVGAVVGTFYLVVVQQIYWNGSGLSGISDLIQMLLQFGIIFLGFLGLLGLPWVGGLLVRTRSSARLSREALGVAEQEQARAESEAARAERDAARAEREAARAERDIAVEQERNRIARDMHDVVAHSLAVVIAQADGARYAARADPASVDEALQTIGSTAREALGDVRVLLGQLRHSQGEAPQPALGDLDKLVEQMRASGLRIERHEFGQPQQLGTNRQLAVYRIVQESLTNALRHGDREQPVDLVFEWRYDTLHLFVTNVVRPPTQPVPTDAGTHGVGRTVSGGATEDRRGGHGLDGMRERAVLAGGSLTTQHADGTFAVHAVVPTTALTQEVGIR